MASYVPNPADPTQPTAAVDAGSMYLEFQALKGYIQGLIASGTNFAYIGSFRNRLQNGGFNVAQGYSGGYVVPNTGATTYTLDRWIVSSTGSITNVSYGNGTTYSSNNYYISLSPASGNTLVTLQQRIQSFNCQDLVSGTSVTVSGWYYCDNIAAGLPSIGLYVPTVKDTYGTTTTLAANQVMVIKSPTTGLVAATWCYFSNTLVLTQDATLGMGLEITFLSGAPGRILNFDAIQLEKGTQATPFEFRFSQIEYAMCREHYQYNPFAISLNANSGEIVGTMFGITPMRAAPSITYLNTTLTNCTLGFSAQDSANIQQQLIATATGQVVATGVAIYNANL